METVTSADGTVIAYDVVGSGPAVVLIGGAFSYRRFPGFVKLASLLSERFTVVSYDRRGRGDSTDVEPYAVEREIEDLNAVINNVGGKPMVFGMSSGGALAFDAAAAGVPMSRIAVYEPPYMVDPSAPKPPEGHAETYRRLVAEGRRGEAVSVFLRNMGAPGFFVLAMRLMPAWPKLTAVAHTLEYDSIIMGPEYALPEEMLSTIDNPTTVISGEKSDRRLRLAADAIAQALPHAERIVLAKQAHSVSWKVLSEALVKAFGSEVGAA